MSLTGPLPLEDTLELLGLCLRTDAYSWQISDPSNPKLWLRVERPDDEPSDRFDISDLFVDDADLHGFAQAFVALLRSVSAPQTLELVFRDIFPGARTTEPAAFAQTVQTMQRMVKLVAGLSGRFVETSDIVTKAGKVDLITRLS